MVISALAVSPSALGDDPCSEADRHVSAISQSLQQFNSQIAPGRVFRVKQVGDFEKGPDDYPVFVVSYEAQGTTFFTKQIRHPSWEVANVFILKPLRAKDGGALGVEYASGAAGRMRCDYVIAPSGGRFLVKRSK